MNAAVTRSFLPVGRDFPVVRPLRFRGLTLQLPSAACVRLRLPLRPCIRDRPPVCYGVTAPPGVASPVKPEAHNVTHAHLPDRFPRRPRGAFFLPARPVWRGLSDRRSLHLRLCR
ncbi:hypothetical protein AHX56_24245 [Salmonella enterica subsp. enterica]|nr:hypothetical protein [Salmonella enterica subsp. enterica]